MTLPEILCYNRIMETFTRKNGYNFNRNGYPHPQKSYFGKHFHDYYELLLFKTGDMRFFVENRCYIPHKNDLFLFPPGTYHFVDVISDGTPYDRFVLQFDKTQMEENLLDAVFQKNRCINLNELPEIAEWFERFHNYVENYPEEQVSKIDRQLIYELLMLLANRPNADSHEQFSHETNPIITKALDYIEKNFVSIQTVDDIANALYISKTYLFYCFKKYRYTSPIRYVQAKKLIYACQLIKDGAKPTEVNEKCGIPEYTTFFRLYKKQFGFPPSKTK